MGSNRALKLRPKSLPLLQCELDTSKLKLDNNNINITSIYHHIQSLKNKKINKKICYGNGSQTKPKTTDSTTNIRTCKFTNKRRKGNRLKFQKSEKKRLQTLVPCVRVTSVLPTFLTVNIDGALMSYQSFLAKGSTLGIKTDTDKIKTRSRMTDHRNVKEEREKKQYGKSFHLRLLLSSFLPLRDPLVLPETNVKVKKISFRRQELHEREREIHTRPPLSNVMKLSRTQSATLRKQKP